MRLRSAALPGSAPEVDGVANWHCARASFDEGARRMRGIVEEARVVRGNIQSLERMTDGVGEGGGGDRRAADRTTVRIRVRFRSADDLLARYTTDISRGGMFVATPEVLPLDAELELALELPDGGEPAIVRGRVVSVLDEARAKQLGRQPGLGVSFVSDASALGERIAAYFASPGGQAAKEHRAVHVLVVEDSATYRAQIEQALRGAGHRVTSVENGLTALGAAVREPPDLVLCDVNMPLMDGWQLVRILRERATTREVPIVFLTTLGGDADRLRGYQLGVDDYIGKPFEPDALAPRLARVLERARAERADGTALPGDLSQVSVSSLLSLLEAERRSGVIAIRSGAVEAAIHVAQGGVTRVELTGTGVPQGAPVELFDRLLFTLDVREGRFAVTSAPPDQTGELASIQGALLEHARRSDEGSR